MKFQFIFLFLTALSASCSTGTVGGEPQEGENIEVIFGYDPVDSNRHSSGQQEEEAEPKKNKAGQADTPEQMVSGGIGDQPFTVEFCFAELSLELSQRSLGPVPFVQSVVVFDPDGMTFDNHPVAIPLGTELLSSTLAFADVCGTGFSVRVYEDGRPYSTASTLELMTNHELLVELGIEPKFAFQDLIESLKNDDTNQIDSHF